MRLRAFTAALLLACGGTASAQSVTLSGRLGDKALLVIDGTPRTLAVGSAVQGVRLVGLGDAGATVEIGGKRMLVPLGGAPVDLGGAPSDGGGTRIVLSAGSGGHFVTDGSINGRAVRFIVDTGATNVSMSESEARRLGIDFTKGQRGLVNTANGQTIAHRVSLSSVRVGDVTVYNVDATVLPAHMDQILLGNSFLSRFQMRRENDTLTLDKRY